MNYRFKLVEKHLYLKKPSMRNRELIIVLILLIAMAAHANDANIVSQPDVNAKVLLGPGIVILAKPYSGVDPTVYPYPVSFLVYDRFYFAIDTAGFRLLANHRGPSMPGQTYLYLDAIAKWRSDGYDSDDSDELEGMHNRHQSIDIGGEFGVSGDWGSVTTSITTDTLNQHDGQEIKIAYAKPFEDLMQIKGLRMTPSAGLAWQSDNLVNYYYGVRSDEVQADRPVYKPDSAENWFIGLDGNYQLNDDWTLLAGITYYWLDKDIRRSPIVSRAYKISIIAGAMYRF